MVMQLKLLVVVVVLDRSIGVRAPLDLGGGGGGGEVTWLLPKVT